MLRVLGAALLSIVALVGVASTAVAADGEVRGRLADAGTPLPDVTITASQDGAEPVITVSDEEGRWSFTLAEGTWTITLDDTTLPDGIGLREGTASERQVEVQDGLPRQVTFFFGEGGTGRGSSLDRAAQLAAEGLRFGLIIALAAVGLSLIFGTTGLTNFAHGEIITGGALIAWFLNVIVGLQFILAAVVATFVMGIVGSLADRGIWRPLRRRGTGLIAAMIVSIGLAILLRYFYLYIFGGAVRPFNDVSGQAGVPFGPIALTPADYFSMVLAIVVLVATGFALLKTRLGKATRAVSDNPSLAAASGIDVDRVINVVWIAGAALAGLAGILLGISQQVSYQMGFQILLLVFAAVTLGGLGTAFGALVGSLIVGVLIQVSTLVIPPELKNVGALGVLIIVLLVKPNGILGRRERVG
jgi:branched-chain amino acid transport system permease protein